MSNSNMSENMAAIVDQRRPTAGTVISAKSESAGVNENVGAAFEIASQSPTVQILFPVPVLRSPSWFHSQQRGDINNVMFSSGVVENVGVAVCMHVAGNWSCIYSMKIVDSLHGG